MFTQDQQAFKVHAFSNTQFDEVGWFYCSAGSTEIDKYVVYNYSEQVWSYGLLERHAWLDAGVEPYPRATLDGYLYEQEKGNHQANGTAITASLTTGSIEIADGDKKEFYDYVDRNWKADKETD